jgi:isocitrate dehydrogenase kinase/phosphatase
LQHAVQERIRFYDERVRECVDRLRREFDVAALSDETWRHAKLHYIGGYTAATGSAASSTSTTEPPHEQRHE